MNSRNLHAERSSIRAFSLFEALVAICIAGILGWVAIASHSNTHRAARLTKLESDVVTINHAVRIYLANGGSLAGLSDPQAVLDKMKTAISAADDARQVGFGGPVLDRRLVARLTTTAEAQSGAKRAVWNASHSRFEITTAGAGVSAFDLDSRVGAGEFGAESRLAQNSGLSYESGNGWIWRYTDTPSPPRAAPSLVALFDPALAGNLPNPAAAPERVQLQPPLFSLPSGPQPLSTFPLSLSIGDSNTSCGSWIMVSVNGGEYAKYEGPLTVEADTRVMAFATGDPRLYYSSRLTEGAYTVAPPVPLLAPLVRSSQSQFRWGTAETISISVDNPNEPEVSSIEIQVAGGAWEPYAGPFELAILNHLSGVSICARAKPLTVDYLTSPESSASIQAPPPATQLLAPGIVPSAPQFTFGSQDTLTVTLTDLNPEHSVMDYRIDGGPWLPYGSGFTINRAAQATALLVEARARSTSPAYADSDYSSTVIGLLPAQLVVPQVTLSSDEFTTTTSTILVTLSDPNPSGRSALYYAVKPPAAAYPSLSSFLPYTGAFAVSAAEFPDGFHVQVYARSLSPTFYQDSAPAEAITMADFFGVGLGGDILIAIDASGSMSARFANTSRFDRVLEEAIQAINSLSITQKFAVLAFNDGVHWSDGSNDLKLATPENKQAAISALLALENRSGTNYEVGLAYAANLVTKPTQVIFLSDGLPNQKNYYDELATLADMGIEVNTVGIGNRNSHKPLEEVASLTGGTYTYVVEPGSKGTLQAPRFSLDGDSYSHTQYPLALTLTNPNSIPSSRIVYSVNGSPFTIYTVPLSLGANSTVTAFVESTDPAWAPSVRLSETYAVNTYAALRPSVILSASSLTDAVPAVTLTLTNPNPAGLTNLIWWYGTRTESSAVPYTGPVTLSASDWNSFAGDGITQFRIYARAVAARSFVTNSSTNSALLSNQTTAFIANLRKPALKAPVFTPDGNSLAYTQFPISLSLLNPNSGLGILYVAINGGTLAPYTGPVSLSYNTVVTAYVKAEGAATTSYRSSPLMSETYTVQQLTLLKPTIQLSATAFSSSVTGITVTLNNPNPSSISSLVYWFEGQDPAAATPYTGPFTLQGNDWETYVAPRRSELRIYVKAVGKYNFAQTSAIAYARLTNTN